MAVVEILARGWTIAVDANGGSSFTAIEGVDTFKLSSEETDADRTVFADNGFPRHWVAARGNSISFSGKRLEDVSTGARDAGQTAIETLAGAVAYASLGNFQLTSPGGTAKTFLASAKLSDIGGGNNDTTSWGFEAKVSGLIV